MNATIPLLHLDSLIETQIGPTAVLFAGPTAAPLPHLTLNRPHRFLQNKIVSE
jgi:hypothetical protein